jgi:hypothetical protein
MFCGQSYVLTHTNNEMNERHVTTVKNNHFQNMITQEPKPHHICGRDNIKYHIT